MRILVRVTRDQKWLEVEVEPGRSRGDDHTHTISGSLRNTMDLTSHMKRS